MFTSLNIILHRYDLEFKIPTLCPLLMDLFQFALVNTTWYTEAIRVLWQSSLFR